MVKFVRVCRTDKYGKQCGCSSADWYGVVVKDYCLSVFGVNCLQLQVLDCLNCEDGGTNLLRNLIVV